ncbi:MAG: VWA domain-containing protein [Gammaproteobacteria bacterium]|nr:VWA domain-containing protein [Gammaproteobacteria bacterium]
MIELELFHFLRPLWLLALPFVVLNWWLVRRREASGTMDNTFMASHLRDALTVNRDAHGWFRPVDGVAIALLAMTVAAAGPTWSKQPSPWFAETAPLVIAMEVSDSMRSNDLQPTRLDRARFKILDLIRQRTGSRTALIAYAGSAHIVMPPTKDVDVVKPFLESFDPAIMPAPGANAGAVLPLARELLGEQAAIATLLFVNDGFDAADSRALAEFSQQPTGPALAALVVGSEAGGVALMPDGSPVMGPGGARLDTAVDAAALRRIAAQADMSVVRATSSDDDIRQLLRQIESNLQQADDPDARWRDEAWWLLWPAALLSLLWFRRGWTMQW